MKTDRIGGEQSHARHRHFGLVDERDRFALVALAMAGNTADARYDLPDAGEDLRVCAASARELLVGLAAERLNLDADRLEASHAGSGLGRVYPKSQFPLTRLGGTTPPVGGAKHVIVAAIAEWCPHCIASSWVLALTLERFGTLTGLRTINSGTYYAKHGGKPAFSHTHGLSFIDATYTSQYFRFDPIVLYAKNGKPLEHATTAEKHELGTFHARGSFPALDLAGAFGVVGLDFSPGILASLSPTQIAGELADPTSAVAPYIDGEANLLTAALCVATGQQPAAVCDSPGVTTAATRLPPA